MLDVVASARTDERTDSAASSSRGRRALRVAVRVGTWLVPALVALALGWWGITATGISRDETATLGTARRTIPDWWRMIHHADVVHGLYYLFIHYWIGWFGTGEVALRVPSLIGTAFGAALLALMGTKLVSRRAGFTAGILFACSPMISMYAHIGRSYGIDSAVFIGLVLLFVRALASDRRRTWIPYGAVLVFCVTLHLFTLLAVPAQGVAAAWYARSERRWLPLRRWLATTAVAMIALTPFVMRAIDQGGTAKWIGPITWHAVAVYFRDIAGGRYALGALVILAICAAWAKPRTVPARGHAGARHVGTRRATGRRRAGTRRDGSRRIQRPEPVVAVVGAVEPGTEDSQYVTGSTGIAADEDAATPAIRSGGRSSEGAEPADEAITIAGGVVPGHDGTDHETPGADVVPRAVEPGGGASWVPAAVASAGAAGDDTSATAPEAGAAAPGIAAGRHSAPAGGTVRLPSVLAVALPWFVIPPLLMFVGSIWDPLYVFRYLLYCLPALMLLAAAGLDRLPGWLAAIVVAALIATTIPLHLTVREREQGANDLRAEAAYLTSHKSPGDAILYLLPAQREMESSYPAAYAGLVDVGVDKTPAEAANFGGTEVMNDVIRQRLAPVNRVWAIVYWVSAPARPGAHQAEHEMLNVLRVAGFRYVGTARFRGGAILRYDRRIPVAERLTPIEAKGR